MPVWLTIILALGGSSVIGYVVTQLCISIHRSGQKYKEYIKREKQNEMREVLNEEFKSLDTKIDSLGEKIENNTKATVTSLRCDMKMILDNCKAKGYATSSEKANWNDLLNDYKALGGNHWREYVNQWKLEMEELPNEKPKRTSKQQLNEGK